MSDRRPETDLKVLLIMLAAVIVPAAFTLSIVEAPRTFVLGSDPSPLGYTWSQLIFLVPVLCLHYFFKRHAEFIRYRKAYWMTVGMFLSAGLGMDILLGEIFFTFPNEASHLGIHLPGLDIRTGEIEWNIPIEEISFYGIGAMFMLLMYLWCDLYWIGTHDSVAFERKAKALPKLVEAHWGAAVWGLVLIGVAVVYKWYVAGDYCPFPDQDVHGTGFPGYMTVLIIGFFTPTFIFFRKVQPFVNWRALGTTIFVLLLMSLVWEGTMGVPYGWWGFQCTQMLGIYIGAWTHLPIEEPILWAMATWGTVMIFEVLRIHHYKGGTVRESLLGEEKS